MKKRVKIEPKLGTYSNDGLGSGLMLNFSDKDMEKMRSIVRDDLKNIEEDFKEQLHRLDVYLKEKRKLPIPKNSDFVKWFFNKKKINEWGENLPEISDDDLILSAYEYLNQLDNILPEIKKNIVEVTEYWVVEKSILQKLSQYLKSEHKLDNETDFFDCLIDNQFNRKVNWKGDKTLLIYLFEELVRVKFIDRNISINSFVSNSFSLKGNVIENAKQSKNQTKNNKNSKPRNYQIIDEFINKYDTQYVG